MNPSRLFVKLAKLLPHALILGLTLGTVEAAQGRAAFNVNSTLDGVDANPGDGLCATAEGLCTLRAAVMESNALPGADAIGLLTATYVLTIPGAGEDGAATGDLDITEDLGIGGAFPSTIDANGVTTGDRAFQVHPSTVVTMQRLHFIGGNGPVHGAAVYNEGDLNVIQSVFFGNGTGSNWGGGIYNGGNLTVNASQFFSNAADSGGGIYNGGTATIYGSFLQDNSAVEGGAIYANFGAVTTVNDSRLSSNLAGSGGAIHDFGTQLSVNHSVLSSNHASGAGGALLTYLGQATVNRSIVSGNVSDEVGGGLYNERGTLTVLSSVIAANSVTAPGGAPPYGGGIFSGYPGNLLRVMHSTISLNSTPGQGGGIYVDGRLAMLTQSTIFGNSASEGGGLASPAGDFAAPPSVLGTILAGNAAWVSGPDCAGALASRGYNLLGNDGGCNFVAGLGDLIGTPAEPIEPLLGPLQNNGGSSWTHALLQGSPAIDAGSPARCPLADQRGYTRPVDGDGDGNPICDIGAFEYGALPAFDLTTETEGVWPD